MKDFKIPIWVVAILFALTTFIFFNSQISGETYFWEDFAEYVYPVQSYAASESANGSTPFWNPYTFVGMPFIADLQVGYYYPLNRLMDFFVEDGKLPVGLLQFLVILHFFIAQLSMYMLARQWKSGQGGALISAISYSFSGLMVMHVIHPMMIYHLAWFPLVIGLLDKAFEEKRMQCAILSGLVLGFSMLSGHPQMTLFEVFFLGLFSIFKLGMSLKSDNSKNLNKIAAFVLPFIIGVGIFAVQYLPSSELAELSQRKEMTYEKSTEGSLQVKQLTNTLLPNPFGKMLPDRNNKFPFHLAQDSKQLPYYYYWETGFYFGGMVFLLGVFYLVFNYKDPKNIFLLSMALLGVMYSLGENFFVHGMFYNFPLFDSFRMPARMMLYFILAFSIFAGKAIDYAAELDFKKVKMIIYGVFGLGVAFGVLTLLGAIPSLIDTPAQVEKGVTNQGTILFLTSAIALLFIHFLTKKKLAPTLAGLLISVIVFGDLYFASADFNASKENPERKYVIDNSLVDIFTPDNPNDLFRVSSRMYNPSYMAFNRNQGMIDRIQLTEGYNPLILANVLPPIEGRNKVNALYNVKYQIDIDKASGQPRFFELPNRFPRAWVVFEKTIVSKDEIDQRMRADEFDYSKEVVLTEDSGHQTGAGTRSQVTFKDYSANEMNLEVEADAAGYLVFSEVYYPAWKAEINGKETKVLNANYSFRALPIQKGKNTIRMYYDSDASSTGKMISIITILASIIGFAALVFVNRQSAGAIGVIPKK